MALTIGSKMGNIGSLIKRQSKQTQKLSNDSFFFFCQMILDPHMILQKV